MDDIWPIIFLAVVLKIPVFYGLWLVWWASQPVPQPGDEPAAEDGEHGFKRWRRDPSGPAALAAILTAAALAPSRSARPAPASG